MPQSLIFTYKLSTRSQLFFTDSSLQSTHLFTQRPTHPPLLPCLSWQPSITAPVVPPHFGDSDQIPILSEHSDFQLPFPTLHALLKRHFSWASSHITFFRGACHFETIPISLLLPNVSAASGSSLSVKTPSPSPTKSSLKLVTEVQQLVAQDTLAPLGQVSPISPVSQRYVQDRRNQNLGHGTSHIARHSPAQVFWTLFST